MTAMVQLNTRWGKAIEKDNVWPEYPRPKLVRDSYFSLNGEWDYCINQSEQVTRYDGTILVPYSPETLLSGVGKIVKPEQYLHYRKRFCLPDDFVKRRVFLHFGAVDQECEVFLNQQRLGGHQGGYLPFHFDVTEILCEGENVLTLCVKDRTEYAPHARGKQKLYKKGKYGSLFYTPQSGIWQTVWLESVPEHYIENVIITPRYDESAVQICVLTVGQKTDKVKVTIWEQDKIAAAEDIAANQERLIKLEDFLPWSPESPHLYRVTISFGQDRVRSYFGMRKLAIGRDRKGILRFFLNNEPYFFNGLLDQGYWPESLLTPPGDEALIYDILKLKEMGYNTIRKHVKIELARFYYHCDRLGMIVWQDMPNGGGDYNMFFVTHLPNASNCFARSVKDHHYRLFKREDQTGREQYYEDLERLVKHLYHYPSIAVWVPFNEGWGQFDAPAATKRIRMLDQTRLVNEACGWFDQKGGDMYSIHNYKHKLKVKPQNDRVVALTEYGGYAYPVAGHMACEKEFGYQLYLSREELTANYKRLWEEEIFPNLEYGLSAAIYTQTSDIEEEINGVMTYDREVDKLVIEEVRVLNERLYQSFREMT